MPQYTHTHNLLGTHLLFRGGGLAHVTIAHYARTNSSSIIRYQIQYFYFRRQEDIIMFWLQGKVWYSDQMAGDQGDICSRNLTLSRSFETLCKFRSKFKTFLDFFCPPPPYSLHVLFYFPKVPYMPYSSIYFPSCYYFPFVLMIAKLS